MLLAIASGRCRIPAISKTKLLVTAVNGFHLLIIAAGRRHPRSTSDFFEICNGKVLFVAKYKVAFSILNVISYDSVVLTLIAKNYNHDHNFLRHFDV